jgi:hypothetical protein
MLRRIGIDPSKVLKDLPLLVRHFKSDPKMVNARVVKQFLRRLKGTDPSTTEDIAAKTQNSSRPAKRKKGRHAEVETPEGLEQDFAGGGLLG